MASNEPLARFLDADLIESMGATLTASGWVVCEKLPPKSKRDEATRQRQAAIRDALREPGPLPDEIRVALLGCFEDLVLGHVPAMLMSARGSGRHPRHIHLVAIRSALIYVASAPRDKRGMAMAHVSRWFRTTEKTIKGSWAEIGGPVTATAHGTAREHALLWSRVFQATRQQAPRHCRVQTPV